ncbi:MAG: hypothetical protein ACKVUS_20250 [Saprospiraceae bacterium]
MALGNTEEWANAKRMDYDLSSMALAFGIQKQLECSQLDAWLSAKFKLTTGERHILKVLHEEARQDADYWNEEEMKIKGVGTLFLLADIQVPNKIKVFYERPLKGMVDDYFLSVITDCMVATPIVFNTPQAPYFFLQEFKKRKGEKNDPEAQMLQAMLIAQAQNNDVQTIYGGFLIGSVWNFTTLIGRNYCASRNYSTTQFEDLRQIVYILRQLKTIILGR